MILSEAFLLKNIFHQEKNTCINTKICNLNKKYNDFLQKSVYDKSITNHNYDSTEAAGI